MIMKVLQEVREFLVVIATRPRASRPFFPPATRAPVS
jgi:hypothetical protein